MHVATSQIQSHTSTHTCILCHPTYTVTCLYSITHIQSHTPMLSDTDTHIRYIYTHTSLRYPIHVHSDFHTHTSMLSLTRTLTPSHNILIYSHNYTLPNHSIHVYSHILAHYPMHSYPLGRLSHPHTSILSPIHYLSVHSCPHLSPHYHPCMHILTSSHVCAYLLSQMLTLTHISVSLTIVITFMFGMPSLFPQDTSLHPSFSHGPHDG